MTPDTRDLLLSLLDQVSISGSSPTLEEDARKLAEARRELLDMDVQGPKGT